MENNRIGAEMQVWRNREERFEKLFPGTLHHNRPFLTEKLQHLYKVQAKYVNTTNAEERLTLKILQQDTDKLERLLYPSRLLRVMRALLRAYLQRKVSRQQVSRTAESHQSLYDAVTKAGLGSIIPQLKQELQQVRPEFSIPLSYYVNPSECMDFKVDFRLNGSGDYRMDGMQAILKRDNNDETRKYDFRQDPSVSFDARQAYNLLKGRAVQVHYKDGKEQMQPSWRQLDLNDRDAMGNYRIKEFPVNYGYDIEKELQKLPFTDKQGSLKEDMLSALKNGDLVEIKLKHEDKEKLFFVEANPQQRSLGLYNAEMKKISLSVFEAKAIGAKTGQNVKTAKIKKLDIVPSKQIRRSRSTRIN
jgi:hypothetical protein